MGRQTKLTPDVQEKVLHALRLGATHRLACDYAGIHKDTFYDWLKRGEAGAEGDELFSDFSDLVKKAQAITATDCLLQIQAKAGEGVWQAAAWILERRFPDEYGKQVVEQKHSGEVTVSIEDRLTKALDRLERLRDGSEASTSD